MKKLIPAILCVFILNSACSVTQEVFLQRDGGGTIHVEIELHDMILSYARDIYGGFTADTKEIVLFDTAAVEAFFLKNPSAELKDLKNPSAGTLILDAEFSDPRKLLDQDAYDLPPVVSVTKKAGITAVVFTLTPENTRILTDPVSLTDSELIAVFGPQSGKPYSEEEYSELLDYAFAEYLDEGGAAGVLSSAVVNVRVRTEGEIVAVTGGVLRGGSALFTLPFIDIVTMKEPIVLSVSYK
ncbi:MAG: hypothetical protein JW760_01995 [Spirochaetales bacterium]|nr:hypothetical protein [Spirochaetales bacterium]